jgi:hypothetical protein
MLSSCLTMIAAWIQSMVPDAEEVQAELFYCPSQSLTGS